MNPKTPLLNTVKFGDLPYEVKAQVTKVLQHRVQIRARAKKLAGKASFSVPMVSIMGGVAGGLTGAIGTPIVIFGTGGAIAYSTHGRQFRLEYLGLFRALKRSHDLHVNRVMENFPYVVINRNGDIVGKKTSLKIGKVQVGRFRIPTRNSRIKRPKSRQPRR